MAMIGHNYVSSTMPDVHHLEPYSPVSQFTPVIQYNV